MSFTKPPVTARSVAINQLPMPTPRTRRPREGEGKSTTSMIQDQINTITEDNKELRNNLEAERQKCEALKSEYSQALNGFIEQHKQLYAQILQHLQQTNIETQEMVGIMNELAGLVSNNSGFVPDTPRVSALATQAKEMNIEFDKAETENKSLQKKILQARQKKEKLEAELGESKATQNDLIGSKREMKNNIRAVAEHHKKRANQLKERIASLENELNEQM